MFWRKKLTQVTLQKQNKIYLSQFDLFDSAHTFYLGGHRGELFEVKIIYQSSDVVFSKQMTEPPLPLPHYFNWY
jgi:hypothetical protein